MPAESSPLPARAASTPGRLPYLPALDGLRGLAVAAVLLFHADVSGVNGGHLGVTVFFTLSGFLITALLLMERVGTGRVNLRRFWARRARRLVPAMLICFPVAALAIHTSPKPPSDGVLVDAVASAAWFANWRFVFDQQTYADLFSMPSPFQHFWSLAVEEQFYVLFPLVLVLVLGRGAARAHRGRLALLLGAVTVLSTLQLARLYEGGGAFSRAYYGTDARIAELLVGALLALAMVRPAGLRELSGLARRAVSGLGLLGLAGIGAAFVFVEKGGPLLYHGGFLGVAVCTAAVLAAAVQRGSIVSRVLSAPPLVLLGVVSYGVYLFHWPIFLMITDDVTTSPALLLGLRLGCTLALAVLSYALIEHPIRSGALSWRMGATGWANGLVAGLATVAVASGVLTVPTPDIAPAVGATSVAAGNEQLGAAGVAGAAVAAPSVPASAAGAAATRQPAPRARKTHRRAPRPVVVPPPPRPPSSKAVPRRKSSGVPTAFTQDPSDSKIPPPPAVPAGALKVVVVGDSIGDNLGSGLRAWAKDRSDVAVYNLAIPACPFSRGPARRIGEDQPFPVDEACAWWADPESDRRKAFEKYDPDIVVTQDGINNVFERWLPAWDEWRAPGHPGYDQWEVDEYNTVFDLWRSGGAQILVTNTPCGDWQRTFDKVKDPEQKVRAMNFTYNRLANIAQADLFERLCPGGQYRDDVEGMPDSRHDGFHMTPEASAALARNWLGPIVLDTAANHRTGRVG